MELQTLVAKVILTRGFKLFWFLYPTLVLGQTNLVPNPSFEYNTGCPLSAGQIWWAEPWIKVGGGGGITYYNECGSIQCAVPYNQVGVSDARSGVAYADMVLAHNLHVASFFSEGNFLGTPLTDTLVEGKKYQVELYLSLWDSARFATKNVGVYFSNQQPPSEGETLVTYIPQVRYEGDFLTDKVGWMRIADEFIAEGGETFMTIGNFDGYHNSDTLNLHEGGIIAGGGVVNIGYWELAAYYIDDVSVVEDTTYHVGIEDMETETWDFTVYPNPATDHVQVQSKTKLHSVELMDISGRTVTNLEPLGASWQADISSLPAGLYLLRATDASGRKSVKKIVKGP